MSDIVDSLPSRPLKYKTAASLASADERFVPVSALDTSNGKLVYTMLYEGKERLTGMGYDESADEWVIVSRRPDGGVLEAIPEKEQTQERKALKDDLRQWTKANYDGEIEYLS